MIIDEKEVIIGSFNFTNATQNRNVEKCSFLILKSFTTYFIDSRKLLMILKKVFHEKKPPSID